MVKSQTGALLLGAGPLFTNNRQHLVDAAAPHKIPTIYSLREFAVAGGPASYGKDFRDRFFQIDSYAGRILKGEKPASLPVTQRRPSSNWSSISRPRRCWVSPFHFRCWPLCIPLPAASRGEGKLLPQRRQAV